MSEEMAKYEVSDDIHLSKAPEAVLREATLAAKALKEVLDGKTRPVRFNGQTYLEFEDWQTLGRFYGVTAKVTKTEWCDYSGVTGFEAHAVAVRADGAEISAAQASCLTDEPNWNGKPLFQLKSMAQTRACAKALRNVLAWVVVLAGFKPTPAEEMDGVFTPKPNGSPQPQPNAPEATASAPVSTDNFSAWTVPFGEKKGQPVTALTEDELVSIGKYLSNAIKDKKKTRWIQSNQRSLDVIQAEIQRRMTDTPTQNEDDLPPEFAQ